MEILGENKGEGYNTKAEPAKTESVKPTVDNKVRGTIFFGAILVLLGVLWLLHNFDIIPNNVFDVIFSWQMLMIVLGGYFLSIRQWVLGSVFAAIGVIFMLTEFCGVYIPVAKVVLPVIVIAFGVSLFFVNRKQNRQE